MGRSTFKMICHNADYALYSLMLFLFIEIYCSHKCQYYSRAYIDFKRPEDVIEFAEFFDGHVFVNEKGNPWAYTMGVN